MSRLAIALVLVSCASDGEWRGGPFVCENDRCEQRYPRLPDDGQWECVDLDGVALCRGGAPPAGVASGPPDRGWRCGARRTSGEKICVALSPAFPDDRSHWRCAFEHRGGERRICVRSPGAPRPTPLLSSGAPECWIDTDCYRRC